MANSAKQAMKLSYLGLGSNMHHPEQQIALALQTIDTFPQTHVLQVSSLYQTQAVGPVIQNDFINAVVSIRTSLSPITLLQSCLALEKKQGRQREHRWGPRIIDCDILWMENTELNTVELTLPHPEMTQRLFVLVPLAELDPQFLLVPGRRIQQQITELTRCGNQRIEKMTTALASS